VGDYVIAAIAGSAIDLTSSKNSSATSEPPGLSTSNPSNVTGTNIGTSCPVDGTRGAPKGSGSKAALGVGIALGVVALSLGVLWVLERRKRIKAENGLSSMKTPPYSYAAYEVHPEPVEMPDNKPEVELPANNT
jgi:hypothetical protein